MGVLGSCCQNSTPRTATGLHSIYHQPPERVSQPLPPPEEYTNSSDHNVFALRSSPSLSSENSGLGEEIAVHEIHYASLNKEQVIDNDRVKIMKNTGESVVDSLNSRPKSRLYLTVDLQGRKSITRVIETKIDQEFPVYKALRIHRSPYLMGYEGFCEDDGYRFYRYEYIYGESLQHFIQREESVNHLSEEVIQQIILQTAKGLQELHHLGVIHCDIKPDNIMLTEEGYLRIIDFDLSLVSQEEFVTLHDTIGTHKYIPPECIYIKVYSQYTDMWSFGVMLYRLITQRHPFVQSLPEFNHEYHLMRETYFKHPDFELLWRCIHQQQYHHDLGDIVEKLLRFRDMDRGTIDQLLQHPWLQVEVRPIVAQKTVKMPSRPQKVQIKSRSLGK